MIEDDINKIIKKVNDGITLDEWLSEAQESESQEQQSSFCLNLPRRLWEQIRCLPSYQAGISNSGRGRPRLHNPKRLFCAVLTKAYFGYPAWHEFDVLFDIPSTTAYDQFSRWKISGLFDELSELRVQCHRESHEIDWTWLKSFDHFKTNIEPYREPKDSNSKEDERMYHTLNFTARGTPRKNRIQSHILFKVREHFHKAV